GYRSVYTAAWPVLQRHRAPAVLALVGRWLEPTDGLVPFGDGSLPREKLLSWEQLRTMTASGLVEVASHTHDLHRGISANPQANSEPAVTSRRYSATAVAVARELGMPVGLTLDDGAITATTSLAALPRVLMTREMNGIDGLAQELATQPAAAAATDPRHGRQHRLSAGLCRPRRQRRRRCPLFPQPPPAGAGRSVQPRGLGDPHPHTGQTSLCLDAGAGLRAAPAASGGRPAGADPAVPRRPPHHGLSAPQPLYPPGDGGGA
ncbi:MAG: polysaccharide deacetylase family protein, partial [Synechococcus sp. Tobar2m-G35]|nr:polysaccharide deacetylase family protein [Synechococcus sp. Tobar2m-G35]